MKKFSIILLALCCLVSCKPKYATVDSYFVGTNFWYGAILGSTGEGGDRDRLARELDYLQSIGVTNLRVLVGADGMPGVQAKIEPCLQLEPGVYNDEILDGLDYLMAELGKRDMKAVLFLNNSWEWSGGYSQYLSWAKGVHWPTPQEVGYPVYMASCADYSRCREAQELFFDHVRFIVSRTNRYTGLPYKEDKAIFSWQIGNEPRAFSMEVADEFVAWLGEAARLIKSIDPNHMVSTGSEGIWGCENDSVLCRRVHEIAEVDYMTCHIWPYNWGWMNENWKANIDAYIRAHEDIAARIGKPFIIEEFGFPRDGMAIEIGTPVSGRDTLYTYIFDRVLRSKQEGGWLHGCNFWGWGGEAIPLHQTWQPGDPYTGDPAQEDQGLNSVFLSDETTIDIIKNYNTLLK